MPARVKRQAVLVLGWLVVTTLATAMAWWSVTFVTAEVADRRALRPSDVVAASVRQVVPAWVIGAPPPDPNPPSTTVASDAPAPGGPGVAVAVPAGSSSLPAPDGAGLVVRRSVVLVSFHLAAASPKLSASTVPKAATPAPSLPASAPAAATPKQVEGAPLQGTALPARVSVAASSPSPTAERVGMRRHERDGRRLPTNCTQEGALSTPVARAGGIVPVSPPSSPLP